MEHIRKLHYLTEEMPSSMVLRVVGVICNDVDEPFLKSGENGIEMQGTMEDVKKRVSDTTDAISKIIIGKPYINLLNGIDEFSHLAILYWGHKVPEASRLLTSVHPMGRKENPVKGIFSTCSPARPNPILMTVARLHKREENVLHVSGLDAIDRSPVIDIKPYIPDFYPNKNVNIAGWMQKLIDEVDF